MVISKCGINQNKVEVAEDIDCGYKLKILQNISGEKEMSLNFENLGNIFANLAKWYASKKSNIGGTDGWMDRGVDVWREVKAGFRIPYSN